MEKTDKQNKLQKLNLKCQLTLFLTYCDVFNIIIILVVHSLLLNKAVMNILSKDSLNQEIKMVNIWKEF